jgi:hypothetical protein
VLLSAVENPMFGVEKTSCENGLRNATKCRYGVLD